MTNGQAIKTNKALNWGALLEGARGLESIRRELSALHEQQRYLETLRAVLQVAPFELDALREARHLGDGVVLVGGLPVRFQRQGERFPDEGRDYDTIHRHEGLYVLYRHGGGEGWTHGWHVRSLLDVAGFLAKHGEDVEAAL